MVGAGLGEAHNNHSSTWCRSTPSSSQLPQVWLPSDPASFPSPSLSLFDEAGVTKTFASQNVLSLVGTLGHSPVLSFEVRSHRCPPGSWLASANLSLVAAGTSSPGAKPGCPGSRSIHEADQQMLVQDAHHIDIR